MASAEPTRDVWAEPQWGAEVEPLVKGSGSKPPETESIRSVAVLGMG